MDIKVKIRLEGVDLSLSEFWDALNEHNWGWGNSWNPEVIKEGTEFYQQLLKRAEQSPEHKQLFDGFRQHANSGRVWGTKETAQAYQAQRSEIMIECPKCGADIKETIIFTSVEREYLCPALGKEIQSAVYQWVSSLDSMSMTEVEEILGLETTRKLIRTFRNIEVKL